MKKSFLKNKSIKSFLDFFSRVSISAIFISAIPGKINEFEKQIKLETEKVNPLREKNIEIVLNKVGLKKINLTQPPEQLSGGQQRRLAVAVQLLRNPSILLLDDPTAGLDYSMRNDVKNLILDLKNKNTIIIVTHEPALFEGIPSRILFLEKGKIKNFMKENHAG